MKALYSLKVIVPFSDVDMMGHVNNAKYLTYFENARTEYLYSVMGKIDAESLGIIIARAEIDYKSPAKWHDELTVNMRTASIGNTSWVYEYEIVNEKEKSLVATGKTVQVAYDYKERTPIQIPPAIRERLLREIEQTKE